MKKCLSLSMSEKAYEIIKEFILSGYYTLDQKITIKDISEQSGIGRSPVAEALKQLQHEGLIVITPKSGNRIWNPTYTEIEQLLAFRKVLEINALKMAANVLTLSESLLVLCEKMDAAIQREDWEEYEKNDFLYHMEIVKSSENKYMISSYQVISDKIRLARKYMKRTFTISNSGHYSIGNNLKYHPFAALDELDRHLTISKSSFTLDTNAASDTIKKQVNSQELA